MARPVVIIGGWAHRLYRLHTLAQPLHYQPLGTFDTDIAIPLKLPPVGEQLRARLLEREFREQPMGDTIAPTLGYPMPGARRILVTNPAASALLVRVEDVIFPFTAV